MEIILLPLLVVQDSVVLKNLTHQRSAGEADWLQSKLQLDFIGFSYT